MSDSMIGIRVADGSFYSILDETASGKKKLVLTTVNDNQSSVQIDLYRGESADMLEPVYVGSLVVDDIEPRTAGDAEIELIIGVDDEGNLNASAGDVSSGEHQSLSVSLESLNEGAFDLPEYDLDTTLTEDANVSEVGDSSGDLDDFLEEDIRETRRSRKLLILVLVILALGLVTGAALLLYNSLSSDSVPELAQGEEDGVLDQGEPEVSPQEMVPVEPESMPATEPETVPVPEAEVPVEIDKPAGFVGVNYTIRWGDTLWDLSETFYRTPWLYGRIARENEIENPDLIYADTEIRIPAQE